MITAFVEVFDDKLNKLKKSLKKELAKDKKSWDRHYIKNLLKEAKELRHIVKDAKKEVAKDVVCPNCGHKHTSL